LNKSVYTQNQLFVLLPSERRMRPLPLLNVEYGLIVRRMHLTLAQK